MQKERVPAAEPTLNRPCVVMRLNGLLIQPKDVIVQGRVETAETRHLASGPAHAHKPRVMALSVETPAPEGAAATLHERAPAKVNLSLRVLGRRADGYHDLSSLVAFAGAGDRLALTPGAALGLSVAGNAALGGEADNLVLKATRELQARVPGLTTGHFHLAKKLPVAAGLGGGSADAAAALRLLARANEIAPDDIRLFDAALATGSDVPACLFGRACLMRGRGETITPVSLPRFGAVLVNPGVPVATADVFRMLAITPDTRLSEPSPLPSDFASRDEVIAVLRGEPNDLEPPAHRLAPVLDDVASALKATPDVLLFRMSGSGATMFALYENCRHAARAAKRIAGAQPGWWVKSTILG